MSRCHEVILKPEAVNTNKPLNKRAKTETSDVHLTLSSLSLSLSCFYLSCYFCYVRDRWDVEPWTGYRLGGTAGTKAGRVRPAPNHGSGADGAGVRVLRKTLVHFGH